MPGFDQPLPIDGVLRDIAMELDSANRLVLAAPPGAGKTTRVPLALLDHAICGAGRIVMLEPRRIAARLAAERMASVLGERVGETVGLSTRIDKRVSAKTRIEVITDGLFTRRILSDPELTGISAVLFDEFHERSLSIDAGLAFALDAQSALREDLRLVLMSATLDTGRIAARLDCPVVESEGLVHPVETRYLGRSKESVADQMARAVRKALAAEAGSILAFLPGAADIRRAADALSALPGEVSVHPLFGALAPAEQDAAVSPAASGSRKVVLATDIAESSLTIEGVRVVIDAGYARVPVFDPGSAAPRLETVRASRASVDQRRGRAGRTEPGVCYRLWDEPETRGLVPYAVPEILNADLSGLRLALAEWGERDADRLTWLDTPPPGRLAAAENLLSRLGALDETGALTAKGRAMARLPLEPRLAGLVASFDQPSDRALASRIAALVGERSLGGQSVDLADRLATFDRDKSPRARALRQQARRWGGDAPTSGDPGTLLATGWPDRIARRRPGEVGIYLLASGQAARVDADGALAKSEWIAVADMIGGSGTARISLAAPITEDIARAARAVETVESAVFDPETTSVRARHVTRLGAIVLSERPLKKPSGDAARAAVLDAVATHGFAVIGAEEGIAEIVARIALLQRVTDDPWPDWTLPVLQVSAASWLGPLVGQGSTLIPKLASIQDALVAQLEWPLAKKLGEMAPVSIELPSGRRAPVTYKGEQAPLVEARVQEFYGTSVHPSIASGRVPVTLSLLSPAKRSVAITKNLPGFWQGGYRDMAKDMRGRYPKHDWPEDPASARPHEGRTKARL